MFFNPRNIYYNDVVTFPSTKSAGALTLYSDELTMNNVQTTHIVIFAADVSKITNTVTVYAKGSFDDGTNWITLGTYTDLANGSGTLSVRKEIPYAPLVKVEVAFNASGALASGHGIGIDVIMQESSDQLNKEFFYDVLSLSSGSEESAYFDVTLTPGSKETAVFSVTGLPSSNGDLTVDGNTVRVYNSAVAEVVTLSVTAGCSTSGNVGIVLPSLAQVDIAVIDTDDAAGVATKIRAGTYTGWTAGGANTTVTFTKDVAGAVSGAAQMFVGETGVTGSITSTTPGADIDTLATIATKIAAVSYTDWDCDSTDAEVTFTGKLNGNLSALVFSAGTTGTTISSIVQTNGTPTPAVGNVTIGGETFAISTVASADDIAADIAGHSFTNWTVVDSTNRVTFTAKTLENVTDLTASSSAVGVSFSAVTTTQGIAVTSSQTVNGTSLSTTNVEKISKVEVVATGVAANINNTTLYVDGSLDGSHWYRVDSEGTTFNAATTSFVTEGFVGNYARVVLVTESDGSLESGHSIKLSAVLKY